MKRAIGYYWLKDEYGWTIGEWVSNSLGGYWVAFGCDEELEDTDFCEIGEQIKKPEN